MGGGMFAIDGCKISSNSSKEWSGTGAEFQRKKETLEKFIRLLLRKHPDTDGSEGRSPGMRKKGQEAIRRLRAKARKLGQWLKSNEDEKGCKGDVKQSNITDNESAKMPCAHGVVQGYNDLAPGDSKHQVIVAAEALGEGQRKQ